MHKALVRAWPGWPRAQKSSSANYTTCTSREPAESACPQDCASSQGCDGKEASDDDKALSDAVASGLCIRFLASRLRRDSIRDWNVRLLLELFELIGRDVLLEVRHARRVVVSGRRLVVHARA